MNITHKICMDLTRRILQPPIQVMQADQYSRELQFLLTANGNPWEIPEEFSAMIRWHRESDKAGGSYDALPDGSLAYSKEGNILTVQLLPQVCTNSGQVYLTVMLATGSAVAHTFTVVINVCKNPGSQESIPAPEPDVYQQILSQYSMMSARVNNLASLEEGSTTGDAELIDGRLDHTGHVYPNIGSHIRKVGEKMLQLEESAVSVSPQTLTPEQQAQARANIGITNNPDVHAKYFTITDDGVVSLKPEYRGATTRATYADSVSDRGAGVAGSKNAELPNHLIIPEIVEGKAVHSLAPAMLCDNLAVESVTLPFTITEISERCFEGCRNLKNVYGTESLKVLGHGAFQKTAIERLKCPGLESIDGTSTFQNCGGLVYADVGNVTTLPDKVFNVCPKLNMVKSTSDITSAGARCFYLTPNLKHADFSGLKNIGQAAFLRSGVDCDWNSLTDCTFGTNATPKQYNPTDFWSACAFTPCENRLPTFLSQGDPRWTDKAIGTSGVAYENGCVLFAIMHIYCGLHNLSLSTAGQMESIINSISPNWLNSYTTKNADIKAHAEGLRLEVDRYGSFVYDENGNSDNTILQTFYDALAAGKYAIISYQEPTITGHAVVAYGINEKGEILIADSNSYQTDNKREATKYALPVSKLISAYHNNNYCLHIVSL